MELHKIQRKILSKAITYNGARFSDLKPESLENDQYNYHLKQLISKNILIRRNNKYFFSSEGKHVVEEEFPINPKGVIANRFKVASLILLHDVKNNKFLYQKRLRQPDYGEVMIPGGPLFKGEMPEETAVRKLKEETGLEASSDDFKVLGICRKISKDKNDEIISDIFYHICYCNNFEGDLKNTEFGENFWLTLDDAKKIDRDNPIISAFFNSGIKSRQEFEFMYSTIWV